MPSADHKDDNAAFLPNVNENIRQNFCFDKAERHSINYRMANQTDKILRDIFKQQMAIHGLSMLAWSKKAGLEESLLRRFLKEQTKSITVYNAETLLNAVGLSFAQIFDKNKKVQIPIRGEVPQDGDLSSEALGYITWYEVSGEVGALRVTGASMNLFAPEGSYVIFDTTQKDGLELVDRLVIIRHLGRLIFRKLCINPTRFEAMTNDRSIEPIYPQSSEDWEIVGRVINMVGVG